MTKWGLYLVMWALALVVSLDFARQSSRGTSLQAYLGIENPFIRKYRARPSGVATTSASVQ